MVRLDLYLASSVDEIRAEPHQFVTVREVVPTVEEAEQEAARLNELNAEKGVVYFWTGARLFPEGRGVQRGY